MSRGPGPSVWEAMLRQMSCFVLLLALFRVNAAVSALFAQQAKPATAAHREQQDASSPKREAQWVTDNFKSLGGVTKIPVGHLFQSGAVQEESLSSWKHHMFLLKTLAVSRETQNYQSTFSVQEKTSAEDTRTQYVLQDDIHLLDAHNPADIRELSDRHILHCGNGMGTVAEGHLVVGSDNSAWFRARHLSAWAGAAARTGLVLGRRVLRVERNGECTHLHTEPIHHLELFKSMRIESMVEHPQARARAQREGAQKQEQKRNRNLQQLQVPTTVQNGNGMPQPDFMSGSTNQIRNCDPYVSNAWPEKIGNQYTLTNPGGIAVAYHSGTKGNFDYDFFFSSNNGCASMLYTAAGANFNWTPDDNGDVTKGTVTKPVITLNGVTGIVCQNCYAYAGGQLYIIFEYLNAGQAFLGEVRISGGAGFNLAVDIKDPAVQSSSDTQLVEAAANYDKPIPLGATGLQVSFKMGGLVGSVSGQGGMKGSAQFGAGLTASLTAGVTLSLTPSSGSLDFPISSKMTWVPPYFKATGFTPIGSSSITTILTATEFVKLAYVVGPLSVALESRLDVVGKSGIGGGGTGVSAMVVVEPAGPATASHRSLKGSSGAPLQLVPGSKIAIKFRYEGSPPGEKQRLFYYLRHSGNTETIMQRDFVNSDSGSGEHVAEWVVPWQRSLAGENAPIVISVRSSSNMMAEPIESATHVQVTAFTEADSLISSPAQGSTLPLDRHFEIKWNPSLLHLFDDTKPGTPAYHGQERAAKAVYVTLVGMKDSHQQESFPFVSAVPNTGHARILLNSTIMATWLSSAPRKYWLEVHEAEFGSAFGWSDGYFKVANTPKVPAALQRARGKSWSTSAAQKKPSHHATKLSSVMTTTKPPPPYSAGRRLAGSCDTAANIPVVTSFGFSGRPIQVIVDFTVEILSVTLISMNVAIPVPSSAPVKPVDVPQGNCISIASLSSGGGGGGSSNSNGGGGGGGSSSSGPSGAVIGGVVVCILMLAAAGGYYY